MPTCLQCLKELVKCVCQHAHVSRGEVIGLLGGTFDEEKKVLKVSKTSFNCLFCFVKKKTMLNYSKLC